MSSFWQRGSVSEAAISGAFRGKDRPARDEAGAWLWVMLATTLFVDKSGSRVTPKLLHEIIVKHWCRHEFQIQDDSQHFNPSHGNAIVTTKISEDKDFTEQKCDFFTPPVPDDIPKPDNDYVLPQGCYADVAAPYILCSGEIDIGNLKASEECNMIWGMGEDCFQGEFSEDVINRYVCDKEIDLIKKRARQLYHDCGI
ncbi:lipase class 3 family protein [Striga asiatica]|uniref:Lipase class 3 family protein n=1 Tax=Striga asiatica TaxID=4170 RepID=A0A5A7QBH9_STRAF|nr:lipase class 3 family protein [Striga asiatica]